jgi:hypothetical protein
MATEGMGQEAKKKSAGACLRGAPHGQLTDSWQGTSSLAKLGDVISYEPASLVGPVVRSGAGRPSPRVCPVCARMAWDGPSASFHGIVLETSPNP